MIKAIIIDDIEQARITLKKDLEVYAPDVTVVGEANGVVEGIKLLKKVRPDVLFLDCAWLAVNHKLLIDITKFICFLNLTNNPYFLGTIIRQLFS